MEECSHFRTISAVTHHHAVDFNIFEGMTCHGIPEYVLTNGQVVVDNCEVKVVQGLGRYIPTPPYSPYVYDLVTIKYCNRLKLN